MSVRFGYATYFISLLLLPEVAVSLAATKKSGWPSRPNVASNSSDTNAHLNLTAIINLGEFVCVTNSTLGRLR